MQNPNFLGDGVDPSDSKPDSETTEKRVGDQVERTESASLSKDLKKTIFYRIILILVLVSIFIVAVSLRAIKLVDHRPSSNSASTSTSIPSALI